MNKKPISRKIITIITVIIIVIMTFWAGVSLFLERKAAYRSLDETANLSIERLSNSLVFPLWNFDDEQVDKILESELQERNFTAISVMDKSGQIHVWIRTDEGKLIHTPDEALFRDAEKRSFLVLKKEIIKGNENLGTIELHVTDYYLKQHLWNTVAKIGLQTMLIIGLMIPLLSIFFNKHIVQRIAKIINGIEEVKKSNYTVSIDVKGNDELSDIAIHINDMTKAILKWEQNLIHTQKAKMLGTLAGGLAHDFNNVLCGILGAASVLQIQINKNKLSKEQIVKRLSDITDLSNRAADIVKRLFAISRKDEVYMTPVDLDMIVKDAMKICENTFDKSIELKYVPAGEKSLIKADAVQIEQVLLNLCINGYHAMTIMRGEHEKQGGELVIFLNSVNADRHFCQTHPEAEEDVHYHAISIYDTGVGMDSNTIAKIFDPFFTMKGKDAGTGLGLAMVYNIIHQYKGFIDVYSEVRKGTTFNVYLPAFEESIIEDEMDKAEDMQRGKGLILVVEDESVIRSTVMAILEECGYNVIPACDGNEAIEIFKQRHNEIKAVLLDLQIPKMSGKEVFIEMKKINNDAKVIITTGSKRNGRVDALLDLGANGFIQKPYTAAEIANTLNDILKEV